MDRQEMLDKIREAGVVGAGGAGFPTHVKLNCSAEFVMANGAECEPLLRADRVMMETWPDRIIKGLRASMEITGARKGYVCLKKKYKKAIAALQEALLGIENIELFQMENYYPAGDEQQIVFDVTGRTVPTGGIPIDVGAVVSNVSTLMNIADALEEKPVTAKYVTVTGEVARPSTFRVPVGTPVRKIIEAAGGPVDRRGFKLIIGGPAMGYIEEDWEAPVTKTTGGVVVLPADHPLIYLKTRVLDREYRLAKSVCCQCTYCTQLCPRNGLGLAVEPHKAMRALAYKDLQALGDSSGAFSCCNCGLCSYYACSMGLSPSKVMTEMKNELIKRGIKPQKNVKNAPNPGREYMKIPAHRLIQRMKISCYDVEAPLSDCDISIQKARLLLKQHIGVSAEPIKGIGEKVSDGDLIAEIPEKKLGAALHASIDGIITDITSSYIEITAGVKEE